MSKSSRSQILDEWALKNNPFVSLPPAKPEDREQVFTGRSDELDKLLNLVEPPRGIFLHGLFGVGKSILVLEALRMLTERGSIAAYAKYDRELGFLKTVLKALATACGQVDASAVYEVLVRGRQVPPKDIIRLSQIETAVFRTPSSMEAIKGIREAFSKTSFVVAVDDLDKGTDIRDIEGIILETRQLIDLGCSVILPGHNFGVLAKFGSAADILYPFKLEPLSEEELVEMMGKYLALARTRESKDSPTSPFSADGAGLISKGIAEFGLTPRIFNFACQLLLDQAADDAVPKIDGKFVAARWATIAENFLGSLKDEDKQYLKVIYDKDGVLSEDSRSSIKNIAGPFAEFAQLRTILANLIQKNVLIEQVKDGKRELAVNPLMQKGDFFIIR